MEVKAPIEHRTSKIIGFKAFYERDDDILDWWERLPNGERSHVLRSLIRAYLTGDILVTPLGEEPVAFASSVHLARVQADTQWIRDALMEIPTYLEQMITTKLRSIPLAAATPSTTITTSAAPTTAPASEEEVQKRAERMMKAKW